jgi:hypothetical protein
VLLNAEEIQFIVDELFVGNRLATGEIVANNGERIDLRKIGSPIIVFCSFGDDITPPRQALDWILDLYDDVDDLIANGQTIIYSVHQSIGHLGIFVSGKVAKKEHEEFTLNMNLVDVMPPGLYEMVLIEADENSPRADLVEGKYIAKVLPRTLDDIRALGHNNAADQRRFETVARVSDINQGLYRTFISPIVKSLTTQTSAEFLREMHPNRVAFRAFSDQNPLMAPVPSAAEKIRADRHPVEASNPFLAFEKMASSWIVTNLEIFAKMREATTEAIFLNTYRSPLLQAAVGLKAEHSGAGRRIEHDLARAETRSNLEGDMRRGEACARCFTCFAEKARMSGSSMLSRACASALPRVSVCRCRSSRTLCDAKLRCCARTKRRRFPLFPNCCRMIPRLAGERSWRFMT